MDQIEIAGRQYRYATRFERWLGQFLDGLAYAVLMVIPVLIFEVILGDTTAVLLGAFPALLYLFFQDGLPEGQSMGKKGGHARRTGDYFQCGCSNRCRL